MPRRTLREALDAFFDRHPALFVLLYMTAAVAVITVLLGLLNHFGPEPGR